MIETSSVPPRKSSASFGNLRQSSGNVRKMFGDVRQAFGTILENLRKVVINGVYVINRIIHRRLEIWNLSSSVHTDIERVSAANHISARPCIILYISF